MRSNTMKVKRSPDAAVASTVQSLMKNQKFKKMFVFSLRTLADLSTPPNIKYKENAICVLEEGGLPCFKYSVDNYAEDEEVLSLTMKTLWALSEGLKEEPDGSLLQRAIDEGAVDTVLKIINMGVKDPQILITAISFIENVSEAGIEIDPQQFLPGLVASLNPSVPLKMGQSVIKLLANFGNTSVGASIVGKANGADKLLNYCKEFSQKKKDDPLTIKCVEDSMLCLHQIATAGHCNTNHLESCITILETYSTNKVVNDRGSAALAAMLGPGQLKTCLETLSNSASGTAQHNEALTMLSSISYIGSYADAIVKAGGVSLLVSAVSKTLPNLSKEKNPKLIHGITGACKMLAKISDMPQHQDVIAEAKTDQLMIKVIKESESIPEIKSVAISTLAAISSSPERSAKIDAEGGFTEALKIMETVKDKPDMLLACIKLLKNGSALPEIAEKIDKTDIQKFCFELIAHYPKNLSLQSEALALLLVLSKQATSAEKYVIPASSSVPTTIMKNNLNIDICQPGCCYLANIAALPNKEGINSEGLVSDALLSSLLHHCSNDLITKKSMEGLEAIATEQDVMKVMKDLEKSVQGARSNPEKALKSLAAVNGLARVSRLSLLFEQQKATDTLIDGFRSVLQAYIQGQQSLFAANTSATEVVVIGGHSAVGEPLYKLLSMALHPQMKPMVEKQDPINNNLLDLLQSCRAIAATDRFSSAENLAAIIDVTDKVFRKYAEHRRGQVECLDFLNELVNALGGEGAKIAVESGMMKQVISYMNKVMIYEDVQATGCKVLLACCQQNPQIIDALKNMGCVELTKSVSARHGRNKNVKKYLHPLLTLMMPEDQLDLEIQETLRKIQKATTDEDFSGASIALKTLVGLTRTTEGSKTAAKHNATQVCNLIEKLTTTSKAPTDQKTSMLADMNCFLKNMASTQAGVTSMMKNKNAENLTTTFEVLRKVPNDSKSHKEAMNGLEANIWAFRQLMKRDQTACDTFVKNNMLTHICSLCEQNPDNEEILVASCGAISASKHKDLANSPEFAKFVSRMLYVIEMSPIRDNRLACVEALEELLKDAGEDLVKVVVKQKGLDTLFSALEKHSQDKEFVCPAQRCVDEISKITNARSYFSSQGGEKTLNQQIAIVCKRINEGKEDLDTIANIRMVNKLTNKHDKKILMESGVIAAVQQMLLHNSNNQELQKQAAALFDCLDPDEQINSIIDQLLRLNKEASPGYQKKMANLNHQLAGYLPSKLEKPYKALEKMPELLNVHCQVVKKKKVPTATLR